MRLLDLAPDIQEAVLFLSRTVRGRDPIQHADFLAIVREPTWDAQKRLCTALNEPDPAR
jgi:hypothetical protein